MGFEGKGVQVYSDDCVRLEQRYQALQARAARTPPGDLGLANLRAEGEGLVDRLTRMEVAVNAEVRRMWEFHDYEASRKGTSFLASLVAPGFKADYRAQFDEAQVFYDEVLWAIRATREEWRDWLALLGGSTRTADGLVLCALGHENHAIRSACLVCGRSLR